MPTVPFLIIKGTFPVESVTIKGTFPAKSVDDKAKLAESTIHYKFTDKSLIKEALLPICSSPVRNGNRAMAQLGEAIMRLILTKDGYDARLNTGYIKCQFLAWHKAGYLAVTGYRRGLDKAVRIDSKRERHVSKLDMKTAVEAIIGAVYLDKGGDVEAVRPVMAVLGL